MAVLNFTGRETIDRSLIEIKSEKDVVPLTIYLKTQDAIKANPHFANCVVVIEAYLRTKAERKELGTLSELKQSMKVVFNEFLIAEGVQYRLKIVNPGDRKLLGVAEGLKEHEKKSEDLNAGKRKTLLPVNWATDADNMKNRFWKVSFKGPEPTLLLRKGKFSTLGDVNKLEFQALAFPAILRTVLTYAFIIKFDNPPIWAADWERLAQILGAEAKPSELSPNEKKRQAIERYFEDVEDWIDRVSEKFAQDRKIDGIDSTFRRR